MADETTLTLTFDPTGDLLQATRECESDVFYASYGNTRQEWEQEYGPYEDSSVFIALSQPDGLVLAAVRLILPGPAGLKSLDDMARPPWELDGYRSARAAGLELDRTVDVATIGVRRGLGAKGQLAAISLYYGIGMATRANELPNIVMIVDQHAHRMLTAVGCTTTNLPGSSTGPYLGSAASTPLWANIPQSMDIQRQIHPDAHRLITLGVGLDNIELPTFDQFKLVRPADARRPDGSEMGLREAGPLPDPGLDLLRR